MDVMLGEGRAGIRSVDLWERYAASQGTRIHAGQRGILLMVDGTLFGLQNHSAK